MIGFNDHRYENALFRKSPVGIAIVDSNGRFKEVNESLCVYLGYSESELRTLKFQSVTDPRDLQGDLLMMQQLKESSDQNSYSMVKRYITKQGKVFWAQLYVRAVRDNNEITEFVSHIIPLPNGGKFKVEEEDGKVIVKPAPSIIDIVMENKKTSFFIFLVFVFSILDEIKNNINWLKDIFFK